MREVELAKSAGFCFGVKRAVDMVYEEAQKGKLVYTLGPIIHNEEVVKDLESKQVHPVEQCEEAKREATIIIRSHGVCQEEYDKWASYCDNIVDATCPFVKKIHNTVMENEKAGRHIIVIGNETHPEVQGIVGWLKSGATVIETKEEAENIALLPETKVCIVAQTTFNYKKFQDLVEIISKKGYDILAVNTICNATKERQEEAENLAAKSDGMIVIGGKHSSNSQKLYEICKNKCKNTFFIQTVNDLATYDLSSFNRLGITAGASTPNNIIQEALLACQK